MFHVFPLQQRLTDRGVEAVLLSDKLNQRYVSGFDFDDGTVLVTRKNAYLLTDFRYTEAAKAQCGGTMTVLAPEQGHLACVRGILEDEGIRRLLIEERKLSLAGFETVCAKLPGVTVAGGASALLDELRAVKDEEELAAMAKAQAITDAAFAHILNFIQPDRMTETEVALELEFFMRRNGAEAAAFDTIAVSGSASSRPHGVPENRKLEKGFLTMDFGARVDGYDADMTRTVVLGKADADMKKLYRTVLTAQKAALAEVREGASCHGLDKIARDIIHGAGYEGCFGHSLGHGVGLFIHEDPRLSPRSAPSEVLVRGNVVTVEPGIYLEGVYGCRIEDMVAIRPDGSMIDFTRSPKELIEL